MKLKLSELKKIIQEELEVSPRIARAVDAHLGKPGKWRIGAAEKEEEWDDNGDDKDEAEARAPLKRQHETKIKLSELRRLIKETMLDILNTETGEILEIDDEQIAELGLGNVTFYDRTTQLPPEEFERVEKQLDDIERAERQKNKPADTDPETAYNNLQDMARVAGSEWLADNPEGDLGSVARDLVMGLQYGVDPEEWEAANDYMWDLGGGDFEEDTEYNLLDALADAAAGAS